MGPRRRRVAWTEGAKADLEEGIAFIAEDSPQAALGVLDRLLSEVARLDHLSERGRIVPERDDPSVRELLIAPFRVLYLVREEVVLVLGVIHQRRDFARWSLEQGRR